MALRLLIAILLVATGLHAEDIYVGHDAAGADDGTSCVNRKSLTWVNSAANWGVGAGKVSAGDTVHLCGTITNVLIPAGSGTAGSPVTFYFEQDCIFERPYWPTTGAIELNGVSYIVIDGGVNGVIRNTHTGTLKTYRVGSRGIGGSGGLANCFFTHIINLTVTNLYEKDMRPGVYLGVPASTNLPATNVLFGTQSILVASDKPYLGPRNLYQVQFDGTPPSPLVAGTWYWVKPIATNRFAMTLENDGLGDQTALVLDSTPTTGFNATFRSRDDERFSYCMDLTGASIMVSNCMVGDADGTITYTADAANRSNIFFFNNVSFRSNHNMGGGAGGANSTVTNFVMCGNYTDYGDAWDTWPNATQVHLNQMIIFNGTYAGGGIRGFKLYRNHWGKRVGRSTTGANFSSFQNPLNQLFDVFIANNFFECQESNAWGNGFLVFRCYNGIFVNNTFAGTTTNGVQWSGGSQVGGSNIFFLNNFCDMTGLNLSTSTSNLINTSTSATNRSVQQSNYLQTVWSDYNIWPLRTSFGPGFSFFINSQHDDTIQLIVWSSGPEVGTPGITNWQGAYPTISDYDLMKPFHALHCDPHSITNIPLFVTGTYRPATNDTYARLTGTNLTTWFNDHGIPLIDYAGNPMPSSGNWNRGAFQDEPVASPARTLNAINARVGTLIVP